MLMCSDDMVECPYNKSHVMLRKRLQPHLLKCRLHYPDVELMKCVFNSTHLVAERDFENHVISCPDRNIMTQYKYDAAEREEDDEKVSHAPVETDENWDETDVPDYDPTKYSANAPIIRMPDGTTPSQRREFTKMERKRLGEEKEVDELGHLHEASSRSSNYEEYATPSEWGRSKSRSRSPRERSSIAGRFTEKRRRNRSPPTPPTPPTPPPPIYSAASLRERNYHHLDEDPYYHISHDSNSSNQSKRNSSYSRDQ